MHVHSRRFEEGQGPGSEQDKAREEGTASSAPARASAHNRRVFASLHSCVAPYFL